jgi:hypothetical protein
VASIEPDSVPSPDARHTLVDAVPRGGVTDYAFHGALFGMCLVIFTLAVLFRVDGPEKVVVPFLNQPLPPTCSMKTLTGFDCPGCGLTRSFVSLAHGNVFKAFSFNFAGPWLFGLMFFQLIYRPWQLWRVYKRQREFDLTNLGGWTLVTLALVLVAQWSVRVVLTMA